MPDNLKSFHMQTAPDFVTASALLGRLHTIERGAIKSQIDLLGAMALGVSNKIIANYVHLSIQPLTNKVSSVQDALGVLGKGHQRRYQAMKVGWAARLLEWAYDTPEEVHAITKFFIGQADLNIAELRVMDELGLRVEDLRIIQLESKGENGYDIADCLNLSYEGVKSRKQMVWRRLGKDNKGAILDHVAVLK